MASEAVPFRDAACRDGCGAGGGCSCAASDGGPCAFAAVAASGEVVAFAGSGAEQSLFAVDCAAVAEQLATEAVMVEG